MDSATELDPVMLAHEADSAWACMRHHEKVATEARRDADILRRIQNKARPRVVAFNRISTIIATYNSGWNEMFDPMTPKEVLAKIAEELEAANQEVERVVEAQQKKSAG
jgi:hypothetical protein